jgi:hypothetical protein
MSDISGLMCDNPKCDYKDMSIKREEYEKHIGFPCPKCGAPLLTQADYDAVVLLEKLENIAEVTGLSKLFPGKTSVKFHGNGFADCDIEEIK